MLLKLLKEGMLYWCLSWLIYINIDWSKYIKFIRLNLFSNPTKCAWIIPTDDGFCIAAIAIFDGLTYFCPPFQHLLSERPQMLERWEKIG